MEGREEKRRPEKRMLPQPRDAGAKNSERRRARERDDKVLDSETAKRDRGVMNVFGFKFERRGWDDVDRGLGRESVRLHRCEAVGQCSSVSPPCQDFNLISL
eukprot:3355785-Rhodomonas_salina.1